MQATYSRTSSANLPLSSRAANQCIAEAWEEARRLVDTTGPRSTFTTKYRNDPAAFIQDCIIFRGDGPTAYQMEVLDELSERKRVSVRSPHGAGKTALAAWVILWFALTRDAEGTDWKIPTTASAWRQLTKYLWPEVRKWSRRIDWEQVGYRGAFNEHTELLSRSLKLEHGEAFALASNDVSAIEGAHATSLLYVFDEAKAIPDDIWDGAEGAFASPETGEALALAISTPAEPQGRFYEIHSRAPGLEDWWVRQVTLQEAIDAGRISQDWADQRKRQWGEKSAVYQNRVLGEFATSLGDTVIPLAWIEAAIDRWQIWQDQGFPGQFSGIGVDVGGGLEGGDATVLATCYDGLKIKELRKYPRADPMTATMETAGRVAGILRQRHMGQAVVDTIGIGAGVLHRLIEQGYQAIGFVASKGTNYTDQSGELGFANWRSAGWWILREMLEPESGLMVCLPDDDELIGDLTAPKLRRILSGGRIQIESKEEIKKRIGRSTDCGDAVMQVLVGPHLAREDFQQQQVIYQPVQIGPDW